MRRIIAYLRRHHVLTASLATVYVVVTVTGHDLAQEVVFWAQDVVDPDRWLKWVAVVFGLGALTCLGWLVRTAWQRPDTGVIAGYGAFTVLAALIGYGGLMMFANECVHFVQFAVLALLVYPLTGRFGETVIWCTLAGAVDEGYQYLVLHHQPGTYFDINDVVLNIVGAGFGVVVLRAALPRRPRERITALARTPGAIAVGLLIGVSVVAGLTGRLHVLPAEDASGLVLRRGAPPEDFWRYSRLGRPFHELQITEGLIVIFSLLVFYHGLDVLQAPPAAQLRDDSQANSGDTRE